MRTKFPQYYHLSDEEKKKLFSSKDCYFVFDTNALLDIYRLGKDTADKVLKLIKKYEKRIIIPYHVAWEYHNRMLDIITGLYANYNNFLDKYPEESMLKKINEAFDTDNNPSIKRKLSKHFQPVLKDLREDLENERIYIQSQFNCWDLQNRISNALGSLVLDSFTEEEIKEIEEEGKERFANKIPPGYKDEEDKDNNKYGDLIIWKEILRYAKAKGCSVIFIGRDMKEDWFQKMHGMTCGPRQELIDEFKKNSPKGNFHIYTLDQFLQFANEFDKILDEPELTEIKDIVTSPMTGIKKVPYMKSSEPVKTASTILDKEESTIDLGDKGLIPEKTSVAS